MSNSSDEGRVQDDHGHGVELKGNKGEDDNRPLQKWRRLRLMDLAPNGGGWWHAPHSKFTRALQLRATTRSTRDGVWHRRREGNLSSLRRQEFVFGNERILVCENAVRPSQSAI